MHDLQHTTAPPRTRSAKIASGTDVEADSRDREVKLSLRVSGELNEMLEQMATRSHTTKSEILRRALTLMEVAQTAKAEGRKFGIAGKDQKLETEIIGL